MNNFYTKENILKAISQITPDLSEQKAPALAELLQSLVNEIMHSERDIYLNENLDRGNGYYNRNLNSGAGKLSLEVPRVRTNNFRPMILPEKYSRFEESFQELVGSMLTHGDNPSEIADKLQDLGLDYSPTALHHISEKLSLKLKDFKTAILEENYLFVYIDAYQCKVKDSKDGKVKKCTTYTVMGVDTSAYKSILGFYPSFGNENRDTWMMVFQDLINRGMKRVLLFISDDFSGINSVIKTAFPLSDIQKCNVHLHRNVFKNTCKEDAKDISNKLKNIRIADTFDKGREIFEKDICKLYQKKYPNFIKHISERIDEYVCFLNYPETIRKHIYTTNPIESVHRGFEKKRQDKYGYFGSVENMELSLFLFVDKMNLKWRTKSPPLIKAYLYELNQMFNMKFFS